MHQILAQEELKWRQRLKENWLKDGDKNTKYLHTCTNQKRSQSCIEQISDRQGQVWSTQEDIGASFINFFGSLFTSEQLGEMESCLLSIERKITPEMNRALTKPFSKEEVKAVVFQMSALKASGPDGFSAGFFQDNWEIIGDEVCQFVFQTFSTGFITKDLNFTCIACIHKSVRPVCVSEFRPISLCNVLYKIISKVLANRLKVVLPHVISQAQSAFIPGCQITDNILSAYETLHTMHTRMYGKKGYMAVKLDMSKANDRVEWRFLEEVMKKLGFAEQWKKLVMMCVCTANYAVLVNGSPLGRIFPTKGIRQGDPISPYLFLLCAEALSSLLTQADESGLIVWIPMSKRGP